MCPAHWGVLSECPKHKALLYSTSWLRAYMQPLTSRDLTREAPLYTVHLQEKEKVDAVLSKGTPKQTTYDTAES